MSVRARSLLLIFIAVVSSFQSGVSLAADQEFDPLKAITNRFPGSVELKMKKHVLEFCPDNTCDGFQVSDNVPLSELEDFAYLYVYFFSDYYVLRDWRASSEAKDVADQVLGRPKYQRCKVEKTSLEFARCVLLSLSSNGRIKLLFIRYDENQRNVVHKDLQEQLSKRAGADSKR